MTTLMTPPKEHVVRLSGPQGMVAAATQALGFEPADSVVLACLTGPRGRVGPVLRVDLSALRDRDQISDLVEFVAQHSDGVAVLVYHDGERPRDLDTLLAALRRRRIPLGWALSVGDGVIRDSRSHSTFTRDPGIALLTHGDADFDHLHAMTVLAGRRVLASREELAASIAPPATADPVALGAAINQLIMEFARTLQLAAEPLPVESATAVDDLLRRALAEFGESGSVSSDTAQQVIAIMDWTPGRDHVLARAVSHPDDSLVPVLSAIATQCPPRYAPQLCSVLAAAAYRFGDGALAHCALDRAEEVDPDHRLALLVRAAVSGGIHPSTFAQLARTIRSATPLLDDVPAKEPIIDPGTVDRPPS